MTQDTNTASGAAIDRYKIGYHADEWGVRSSTPGGITDPSGQWVLYKDHLAALESHGQAPAGATLPEGWVPLVITHEGQYPEEVAYGPQRMMDRLGKWLRKYFDFVAAAKEQPEPAADLQEDQTQPWYDLAWKHGARRHASFDGDELTELSFRPAQFDAFCAELAPAAGAVAPAAQPAPQQEAQEPVAVIGADFTIFWAGHGPIAPIVERHALKVGSPLYAAPQPSPAAQGDALGDALEAAKHCLEMSDPLQGAANWLVTAHSALETSTLAGKLSIGYNRAKRLHDAARAAQGGTKA